MAHDIDDQFASLNVNRITDLALDVCARRSVTYAATRIQQVRTRFVHVRDRVPETALDHRDLGIGVRVILNGAWGFAGSSSLDDQAVQQAARRACDMAARCSAFPGGPVELAEEAAATGLHVSEYEIDPWSIPMADVIGLLTDRCGWMGGLDHSSATAEMIKETTFLADAAGSRILQQRVRVQPDYTGVRITDDGFDDMSTTAPPVGRGWEYFLAGWDWESELRALPERLDEKVAAPSVEPGRYDLVIDPTNLWLTIHESVGHATEKDRALGYEANYAGTTFATIDQLGALQYGSDVMNVRADRTTPHGLSTVGWDDEAVPAQQWDLVREGVLVGYQLDRQMAGTGQRSNGCAYADSALHVPIQRMPNVSLMPDPEGPGTDALIASVTDGIYVVGDKSWSIDMQRYNFQFTGQRFYRIVNGRLAGQVRDVAYQSNTLQFWSGLAALGGPETFLLGGAVNCGKGQPGQVAPVSHGCPSAVFTGVNILNTRQEAG